MAKAHPEREWDASPPPSWSASALRDDDALVHVGAQQSSPSLPFSQPLLPAVPASPPQVGMSAHHAEPATSGQQGKHTVPPDVEQRHAQLDDWQKKMHQRFRREMMGQLPDELPPLSPMQGTDAGIRDAEGRGRYSDLHQKPQMDGNYYAAHAHDKYHAGPPPMHQFVDPAGMLAHHDLQNSPAVTAGGGVLGLDTSRGGISPASPAYSGISSPGSASPMTPPSYRYSPDFRTGAERYSPSSGADSPGSLNGASSPSIQKKQHSEEKKKKKKKKKGSEPVSQMASDNSPPTSPKSPEHPSENQPPARGRLRLGVVIAHYDNPQDTSKRLHIVHGMSEDGAARRSRLVQEGDVIRAINHEPVDHLEQNAVRIKFEEAQSKSDHIVLDIQRNGSELQSTIHLSANYYQTHGDGPENGFHVKSNGARQSVSMSHEHNAIHHGNAAPIANLPWPAFGLPSRSSVIPGAEMGRWSQNVLDQRPGGIRMESRSEDHASSSYLAGHVPPPSPLQRPHPTRLVYPPPSPTIGTQQMPVISMSARRYATPSATPSVASTLQPSPAIRPSRPPDSSSHHQPSERRRARKSSRDKHQEGARKGERRRKKKDTDLSWFRT